MKPIARRALAAQSDERLVRLLREGYDAAFDEIVGRYQQPLTAFAAAIVPYHRAEDVVQASLLRAHKALLADEREVSLRAWLFTIVRNGALNVVRDDPDWQELDPSYDGVPQPAAIAEQNEELQALVTAICALPDSQRQALVRRELEGEGHSEIAAELGTTATAVRGLIFRARTTLRDALGAAIPLPLLRVLLVDAPAAAGVATGAGAGAAAVGGGTKVAAAVSAGVMVLGGGVAIERSNRDGSKGDGAKTIESTVLSEQAPSGAPRPASAAVVAGDDGAGEGGGDRSGRGSGDESGHDDDARSSNSGDDGDAGHDGDDRSGPGGGDDPEERKSEHDNSGPGGGNSGPGGGGNSGPGGERESEDDRSGPGGGGGEHSGSDGSDDDGSESGSGGSGGSGSSGKGSGGSGFAGDDD